MTRTFAMDKTEGAQTPTQSSDILLIEMSLDDSFISNPDDDPVLNLSRLFWEPSLEYQLRYNVWLPALGIAAVYALIIVVGLVGNITLMKTCLLVRSMRTVPNLFLSSLALGDVLLLVTCAPVDASRYLVDQWIFGRVGCKLIPFIQLTSVGVSVFTLTALSADRYRAIVRPLDLQSSKLSFCLRVGSIWLLSGTLAIPEAVFSDLHTFTAIYTNETFVTCAPYPQARDLHPKIHSTAFFLVFYIVPLSIISIYYCFIARSLIQSSADLPAEDQRQKQVRSRQRLARIVLVFVGLFAVCWLPSHVIYLYRSYHYDKADTSLGHFIASVSARILAFTNSCVNPFALYLMSKNFRKHFNKQLLCTHHRHRPPSSLSRTNTRTTTV